MNKRFIKFVAFVVGGLAVCLTSFVTTKADYSSTQSIRFNSNSMFLIPIHSTESDYNITYAVNNVVYREIFYYQQSTAVSSDHIRIGFNDVDFLIQIWNGDWNEIYHISIDSQHESELNFFGVGLADIEGNNAIMVNLYYVRYDFDSNDFLQVLESDNIALVDMYSSLRSGQYRALYSETSMIDVDRLDNTVDDFHYAFGQWFNQFGSYFRNIYDSSFTYYRFEYNPDETPRIFSIVLSFFGDVLSMDLFPGIKIGYIVLLPVLFGAIGLILKVWGKD